MNIDTMFKILAILGALAWLPQLIIFLRNWLIKPELQIIPENQLEIGFTMIGPIINLNFAILSEKQKALIKNIEIELKHEDNDIQKFKWKWFEETLYTVDYPDKSLPTKKNQTAIAINIQKDELVEKKIGFQQKSFQLKQKAIVQNTIEEAINLSKADKDSNDLKSSKNYNDLKDIFQNGFNWKVGNYTVKYKVYEKSNKKPFIKEVSFKMTSLDVSNLKTNIDNCNIEIERTYIGTELPAPVWNWVYIEVNE